MAALATALHAHQRLLSVAVFAKTSEPGRYDSQKVYDYKALGAAVDELKIMTYSYSGPWSAPGPQAPLAWTRAVIDFARTSCRRARSTWACRSTASTGTPAASTAVQASDAEALIAAHHFKVAHDPASGEADLSYIDTAGVTHVLWFIDLHAAGHQARPARVGLPRHRRRRDLAALPRRPGLLVGHRPGDEALTRMARAGPAGTARARALARTPQRLQEALEGTGRHADLAVVRRLHAPLGLGEPGVELLARRRRPEGSPRRLELAADAGPTTARSSRTRRNAGWCRDVGERPRSRSR